MNFFGLEDELPASLPQIEEWSDQDIAIIGISASLPLVQSLEEFWTFVSNGVDFVSAFPESRRKDTDPFLRQRQAASPEVGYMDGAYLDEIDKFDHKFFRLSPKEAALMTPNQRLLLETTWKAVEDSGYGGDSLAGSRTGVFIGFNNDALFDYKRMISDLDPSLLSMAVPGNLTSVLAGRISYVMDWHGPSLCIDTACSSSLVALHQACQAIRNRECEMAAVGSVKVSLLPLDDIRIGIESSDWRARTFDDSSDGTGGGEGVIAFILKPSAKAMEDGDSIYAIIKGSAVNQDGNSIGITAPNVLAQEDVLVSAWRNACIDPATLGYLEAHGTGTKLGDPIEVDAISRAFSQFGNRRQSVAIGSVKTNVGHLDHAAGLMGILKAVLALKNKQIPPTLHFDKPNRSIDFIDSPVYINDELRDWETAGHPRRCGVSAFGMSGTNCHVVLEEAPQEPKTAAAARNGDSHLLVLSAKSEASLLALAEQYMRWSIPEERLADACFTALAGRGHYTHRFAFVFKDGEQLNSQLEWVVDQGMAADEANGIYFGIHKPAESMGEWGNQTEQLISQLRGRETKEKEILVSLARLYTEGASINGHALYAGARRRRIRLPAYVFERTRCWLAAEQVRLQASSTAMTSSRKEQDDRQPVRLIGRNTNEYSATEQALASIWGDQLGIEQLHLEDTYYELGGDSILALKIVNRIHSELQANVEVSDLLRNTSIALLAEWIDRREDGQSNSRTITSTSLAGLPKAEVRDYYPLTPSQLRVFIQQQLDDIQTSHNAPFCVLVEGELDVLKVEAALSALVDRHESFRMAYDYAEGAPVQRVIPCSSFELQTWESTEEQALTIVSQFIQPFDLTAPPLIRAGLIRLAKDRQLIVLDMHHISTDGVTNSIFIKEFIQLYAGQSLAASPLQYKDYAVWLHNQLSSGAWSSRAAYWSEKLKAPLPLLQLPADHERPGRKTFNGHSLRFSLDSRLVSQLRETARREGTTLNSLLFAMYTLLLHHGAKQQDIIVGSLVSGRSHPDLEAMAGMFINFLPIRIKLDRRSHFRDYLKQTHQTILSAYEHDYPFDQMLLELAPLAERSRNPVYDTMFVFHNEFKMNALESLPLSPLGLRFTEYPIPQHTAALDLKLDVWENASDELEFVMNYSTDLFEESTMLQFQSQLVRLMKAALDEPELDLDELGRRTNDSLPLPQQAVSTSQPMRIAISASFTAEPVGDYIAWWCKQFQVDMEVIFAPYHQVFQQLLNAESLISKNQGASVLLIRFEDWIRDDAYTDEQRMEKLEQTYDELAAAIRGAAKQGPWFVGLFPATEQYGPVIHEYLSHMNQRLKRSLSSIPQIRVLDFRDLAHVYQLPTVFDHVKDQEGHMPFTDDYFAALGTAVARAIIAWNRPGFKVIVLDCDNTLWQGICGESGALGVTPHTWIQRQMIESHDKGMLLALCSKNNEADVWEVFDKHPQMLLRREQLVGWRINWQPKSVNIQSLAEQLNLGLDSFIFLDDSAFECEEMRRHCPEVLTIQLPVHATQQAMLLKHIWAFDKLSTTGEDQNRTAMYRAEQSRKELQSGVNAARSLSDFLMELQLQVRMAELEAPLLARAAQLTERTNQFNMNGVRRTEEEIAVMASAGPASVWTVEVRDRFGDYGMVGLISGRAEADILKLDSFMLSCRVLGRQVEHAVLSVLRSYCEEQGLTAIQADYRITSKNEPFRLFLEETGWLQRPQASGAVVYELKTMAIPDLIEGIKRVERWPAPNNSNREAREQEKEAELQLAAAIVSEASLASASSGAEEESTEWDNGWTLPEQSVEQLHGAYLLPLRYYRGDLLLKLPLREWQDSDSTRAPFVAPISKLELELTSIWECLLAAKSIGARDHFFELGGNSLQAASLASRIYQRFHVQLTLRDLFRYPVLADMAERIGMLVADEREHMSYTAIPAAEQREDYPVSSAQLRLLILSRMNTSSTSYNMPTALSIQGKLDMERLESALLELISRHESLRTAFHWTNEEPVQRIMNALPFHLEYQLADDVIAAAADFVRPFDLGSAPLLRARVLELSEDSRMLLLDMHHLIADGISLSLLAKEVIDLYEGAELPKLRIQYKDYAVWQKGLFEQIQAQEAFWLESFQGEIPLLDLPTDRPRSAKTDFKGARLPIGVEPNLRAELERIARENDATVYMVLLSAFSVLLSLYAGQEDIVIGSPVAGRNHADLEPIVGMFVNTLALRLHPVRRRTFADYLAEVKAYTLQAFEQQNYPFEELVDKLHVQRDLTRNPLFDAFFVVQNMNMDIRQSEGLQIAPYPLPLLHNRFDLTLEVIDQTNQFGFSFEYNADLFNSDTVARMGIHYIKLLQAIAKQSDIRLGDIDLLPASEKERLLSFGVPPHIPFADDRTVHEQFQYLAAEHPERIAVIFDKESLTYGELNERANRIAWALRGRGICEGSIVALMLERSMDMIVGVLGIMKAGGAYLPIDPTYPRERKEYMLADSGSCIVLTQSDFMESVDFGGEWAEFSLLEQTDCQSNNPEPTTQSTDLAYVIYTSGSTGKPKGVMIEHRGVLNLQTFFMNSLHITPDDRILQFASLSFDASAWEMFMALLTGASLVLVTRDDYMNYAKFETFLNESGVTVATLPPNYAIHLRPEKLTRLRTIVTAGSAATAGLVDKWKPYVRYYNAYGPTETTVCATIWEADGTNSLPSASVSIGKPITNTEIYIVDEDRKLRPIGVSGEICIGGAGVGRGYMNREELTQERFVPHPFQSGERIYRTGDLGRWLADGTIEYLGRLDEQVKIRGFRVELGEIEAILLEYELIHEAVVLNRKDGENDSYLCAYYAADAEYAPSMLRQLLLERLPDYMIPSVFIWLDALPVTPSGKVDRKALPEPPKRLESSFVSPRSEAEERLKQLWIAILRVEAIGVTNSFFELGGDSLKAALLLTRIQQEWQVDLSLAEVFRSPTIEQLALVLESAESSKSSSISIAEQAAFYPLSSGQKRLFIRQQLDDEDISYNMPGIFHVHGSLDIARLERAVKEIIRRHESLRTSFIIENGEFVQRVANTVDIAIERLHSEDRDEEKLIRAFIRPFSLECSPLLRVGMWQQSSEHALLLFDIHHIISDGVSIGNLVSELTRLYEGEALEELSLQYKDYAVWQQRELGSERMLKQASYWQNQLTNYLQGPPLPSDYPREVQAVSTAGRRVIRQLEQSLARKLQVLGNATNTTIYMILSAAYQVLVASYSGRMDVAIGSHVAGRTQPGTEELIGMFVNTVVLRAQPEGSKTIADYLSEARRTVIESLEHSDYPFDQLTEKQAAAEKRDPSRNPLFDALFILQSIYVGPIALNELHLSPHSFGHPSAKFDWTLEALELAELGSLQLTLEYKTDLFLDSTAETLMEDYITILAFMAEHLDKTLGDIPLASRIATRKQSRIAQVEFTFDNWGN